MYIDAVTTVMTVNPSITLKPFIFCLLFLFSALHLQQVSIGLLFVTTAFYIAFIFLFLAFYIVFICPLSFKVILRYIHIVLSQFIPFYCQVIICWMCTYYNLFVHPFVAKNQNFNCYILVPLSLLRHDSHMWTKLESSLFQ